MAGWHHQYNGQELGQTSRDGEGQRDLACCSLWGHKESDVTGDGTTITKNVNKTTFTFLCRREKKNNTIYKFNFCSFFLQ